jgi:hypothetical protein
MPSIPNISLLAPKKSLTIIPSENEDKMIALRSRLIREYSVEGKKSWPSVGEIPTNILKTDSNVNHIDKHHHGVKNAQNNKLCGSMSRYLQSDEILAKFERSGLSPGLWQVIDENTESKEKDSRLESESNLTKYLNKNLLKIKVNKRDFMGNLGTSLDVENSQLESTERKLVEQDSIIEDGDRSRLSEVQRVLDFGSGRNSILKARGPDANIDQTGIRIGPGLESNFVINKMNHRSMARNAHKRMCMNQ